MEEFDINVRNEKYHIKPALHEGFYLVEHANKSAILGQRENGEWEFQLQNSDGFSISAVELGREIELYLKGK